MARGDIECKRCGTHFVTEKGLERHHAHDNLVCNAVRMIDLHISLGRSVIQRGDQRKFFEEAGFEVIAGPIRAARTFASVDRVDIAYGWWADERAVRYGCDSRIPIDVRRVVLRMLKESLLPAIPDPNWQAVLAVEQLHGKESRAFAAFVRDLERGRARG